MTLPDLPIRLVFAAIFLLCLSFILAAIFYFQGYLGLAPCPMCILSRVCYMAIGAVALVAAIHGPRGKAPKAYGVIVGLLALVGLGISLRHSWLQHFPPPVESCGADLDFILNTNSLAQALPKIFAAPGSCSEVQWSLLGLSIPEWAGIWYVLIGVAAVWYAFRRRA